MIDRRTFVAAAGAIAAAPASVAAAAAKPAAFPDRFLWGAATAGHQVEGNNVASDLWLLENIKPSIFAEPSGDACNSLELWPTDLDLVKNLGLNTYRFSLEWARIEPEPEKWSIAMLDHYKAMIDGCRARGLTPVVTFSHFTSPRWFAVRGGWTTPDSPALFARFCDRAMRHLGAGIGYAVTMNEPNILQLLRGIGLPQPVQDIIRAMLKRASEITGGKFVAANTANYEDFGAMATNMIAGHRAARAAIKGVRGDLPVGVSLAMTDDQVAGPDPRARDGVRAELYDRWLDVAREDDFIGVQNYERSRIDAAGKRLPPPPGATLNWSGAEVYPGSLAGAVRYAHQRARVPVLVSEHGVGTDDDTIRARLIPAALTGLKQAMDEGVPVIGYIHWSLLDNFEWIFGYKPKFGLVAVDRTTFKRTPKPSATVLGGIATRNRV